MELMNFTNLPTKKKSYGGANGSKLSVIIEGNTYMLKLPAHAEKNSNMSYENSAISEYLGSHIFNMAGIIAQETILGIYTYKGINRIAVACKDFTGGGSVLQDFASLKNQIIDSGSNGLGTELEDILEAIEKQTFLDPAMLTSHFWDMFAIDAFIGNWDRHNGNWGFLYNEEKDELKVAPIFDCGSCLFPQADEETLKLCLKNEREFKSRIYDFPTSSIKLSGRRINYYNFIKSHAYKGCDEAFAKMKGKINLAEINELIDDLPCITDARKTFLKKILKARFETFYIKCAK